MPHPDDERLGRLLRMLRRDAEITQRKLATVARVPLQDIIDIEAGRVGRVKVERARMAFAPLDARVRLTPWWHGANADRLLDRDHAAIVEVVTATFLRRRWRTLPELTFSEFGERGSIDLLAGHDGAHAVAVCEVKSAFGSMEETNRILDVKVRLAPRLAERAFGWRPRYVGRLLIVPDEMTLRRIVLAHSATLGAIYPERSRAIRAWLRGPARSIAGIWFVSKVGNGDRGST